MVLADAIVTKHRLLRDVDAMQLEKAL